MSRLFLSRYLVWLALAALLAGCGTASTPTPTACAPSVLTSIPKTESPSDTLLSLEYEGGLVPIELSYPFGRVPEFFLRADGTAFYVDPEGGDRSQLMEAHLSPSDVQGLLQSVLGLGFECLESYTDSCWTLPDGTQECVVDAGASTIRVRLPSGKLREIHNTAEFANDRDALRGIRQLLEQYTHPSQRPYVPDAAALFLRPTDQPAGVTAIAWPPAPYSLTGVAELCVWPLGGAELADLITMTGRNMGDFWIQAEGQVYYAHLTPWLPGSGYVDMISSQGLGCPVTKTIMVVEETPTPTLTPVPPTLAAVPSLRPGAGGREEHLTVRAFVDGRSQLVVKGDTVYWHHLEFAAPGRLCQSELNVCQDYPTYLNGIAWTPRWPDLPDAENRDCNCDSSAYFEIPPLAAEGQTVRLAVGLGRGQVVIAQQPAAANDDTLIVEFDDSGPGGAEWYEITLYYRPGASATPVPRTWQIQTPPLAPSPRMEMGFVYDSGRDVVVAVGGTDWAAAFSETWEYDGLVWTLRKDVPASPGRIRPAMAYDSERQVSVLFGGSNLGDTTFYSDTWEYDGVGWVRQSTAGSPGARNGAAVAYDRKRMRLVLFGGYYRWGPTRFLDDTWEYDGAQWMQRTPEHRPEAREAAQMVYDARRGVVVLFGGGRDAGGAVFSDTWEWDGTDWTWRSDLEASPPARWAHAMAYDESLGLTVLFGGLTGLHDAYDDTWEYDGSTWTQMQVTRHPSSRWDAGLAYDQAGSRFVLFGGQDWDGRFGWLDDTWHGLSQ